MVQHLQYAISMSRNQPYIQIRLVAKRHIHSHVGGS
jgi:hypothetical protein